MWGLDNTVVLADVDTAETFGTLVGYVELSEAVEMLQALGVPTDKVRGLVCMHALREAGLD